MDEYNGAVQHPKIAFRDPVLKATKIAADGRGLPIALGGTFALTYNAAAQGRKFAIRCFHKDAKGLEARYGHVDRGLRAAGGPYFVGFEYQPTGILVNGNRYPIVKMDWVEGDTLGSFLEQHYPDRGRIERLRSQFANLERFLRSKGLAHGDLQNGNVLVKSDLKLIDYDGIYVPTLPTGRGAELGQKHFQHPERSAADFGPDMDRFSFIVIDLSLRAVAHDSKLFSKYSNGENIIFTANDFVDPRNSAVFADLNAVPSLARDTANLASICKTPVKSIPTLEDFLAARNISATAIITTPPAEPKPTPKKATYIGAYDVVDANDFFAVVEQVGNRVELIGKVTKVHLGATRYGKPFCFVFFDHSRPAVKLNIWSEGLAKFARAPSQAWVGTWLSVQGLVDPVNSGRYGKALSVTITSNSQIRPITEAEAQYRLKRPNSGIQKTGNRDILDGLDTTPQTNLPPPVRRSRTPPSNRDILSGIGQGTGPAPQPIPRPPPPAQPTSTPPSLPSPPKQGVGWGWIVFGLFVLVLIIKASSR